VTADEILAAIASEDSELSDAAMRDVAHFTVGLFAADSDNTAPTTAGTGTLVHLAGHHHILTAAHVWEEILSFAPLVGFTLKEGSDRQPCYDRRYIIPSVLAKPETNGWSEWGPDLALLTLPEVLVGLIENYRVFYDLDATRSTPKVDGAELRFLMGAVDEYAVHRPTGVAGKIACFRMKFKDERHAIGDYDYIDLTEERHGALPKSFKGLSGGGLWREFIYPDPETTGVKHYRILEGVAFYELPSADTTTIRCHGPNSIVECSKRYKVALT
jgi:hypothetical protein